jgi:glc operon protein GlcG
MRNLMGVKVAALAAVLGGLLIAGTAHAQLLDKKAISLAEAKKMVAAAEAEANKNKWGMCIVVVDANGDSILSERMDDCQIGSVDVALAKARTAARFRRPSKVFEDFVAAGRNAVLGLGVMPIEGGINLVVDGKTIGAIGCSGGSAAQDGVTCKAGVDAFMK